jgi:aspartyl-tRNA(Asn)/glutamyl-tRNA(Gln) amidotransferase subunit A
MFRPGKSPQSRKEDVSETVPPAESTVPPDEISELDARALKDAYARRELSPVDVVAASAARIEATQPTLNAFRALCIERALAEAREAEKRLADGEGRSLEGVPFAVKDLIDTADLTTSYGSSIYSEHVPSADAEAVRLARQAGAILIGKTSTHEFAWGITSENPHYGPCRNPWDTDRVAGGSSGGSAVALATGVVPLTIGTDTGGSVRIPSAFCGTVGLKPTFDRISTDGVFALAESMDHVGPMARTPEDAGLFYSVLAGLDGSQGTAASPAASRRAGPEGDEMEGLRIGVSADFNGAEPTADVARVLAESIATCEGLGALAVELEFSGWSRFNPVFATIQRVEALQEHRRRGIWPERAAEYGEDVRGRMELGLEVELAEYLAAVVERSALSARLAGLLAEVDLLLMPVAAGPPALVGEHYEHRGSEVEFRSVAMSSTLGQNLAGLPSCAVRGGFDADGLPVGLQFTARHGAESRVLAAAAALTAATPEIQARRPPLSVISGD